MNCNCPNCGIALSIIATGGKPEPSKKEDIGSLLAQIHDDELETDFEIKFMESLRERFAQYGPRTMMSEKQMTTLRKIAAGNPR